MNRTWGVKMLGYPWIIDSFVRPLLQLNTVITAYPFFFPDGKTKIVIEAEPLSLSVSKWQETDWL